MPLQVLTYRAFGVPALATDTDRTESPSLSLTAQRFLMHSQEFCELACCVMPLDAGASHAVTISFVGSDMASIALVLRSRYFAICEASSFGVSYSGQSSRNSLWSRYACRSFSDQ